MTHAEAIHAHLAEQRTAAERELDYAQRHARAAVRGHAASPSPETRCALANAQASVKSAATALEQAAMRLSDQVAAVDMERIAANQPVSP